MLNSQRHSSTTPNDCKPALRLYASFNTHTLTWTYEATDGFGQLLGSDFGRAPEEITDGIAFALARAHRVISDRFPDYQVTSCLTEFRGFQQGKERPWAA